MGGVWWEAMNQDDIFKYMQMAVEAAQTSAHPTSKVGACLVKDGQAVARANFWPEAIQKRIGTDVKIGNASGTVHAETACILDFSIAVAGADVFSTDPSCPNCTKNMAEAGVRHLYIDHKGFEKYFAKTRMQDFESLSLAMCRAVGMGVSVVYRKEQRVEEQLAENDAPDFLDFIVPQDSDNANAIWAAYMQEHERPQRPYSAALCRKGDGFVILEPPRRDGGKAPDDSKYNFNMQPLTRLLMIAAREGLQILPDYIYTSRVPTARELVNFVGGGYGALTIGDTNDARDEHAFEALQVLTDTEILSLR